MSAAPVPVRPNPTAPTERRTTIKREAVKVLETFPDRIMTSRDVYDLIELPFQIDIRELSSILFQLAKNKQPKYRFIQNPAKGRYVWTKSQIDRRPVLDGKTRSAVDMEIKSTPVVAPADPDPVMETVVETAPTVNVTPEVTPSVEPVIDSRIHFVSATPVVSKSTRQVEDMESEMLLQRADGTFWLAKRFS